MKLLLFTAVALLLFFHGSSQSQNSIFTILSNQGDIIKRNKIVKEVIYNYNFKKNNLKDSFVFATYYYDSLGNVVEEKIEKTKISGETIRKYTYTYNERGKLTKQVIDMPAYKMTSNFEYEYDSVGNEIKKYEYNQDTTLLTIRHKIYNSNNQITQLIIKINHSDFYLSREYYYNTDNELSKEIAFNPKGEIIYTYFYDYDKLLNKKTVYLENQEGKKRIEEYFYNNEKQIIKTNSNSKRPSFISRESTEYENLNMVMESVYNQDSTLFETVIYIDGKRSQLSRHYYFKD